MKSSEILSLLMGLTISLAGLYMLVRSITTGVDTYWQVTISYIILMVGGIITALRFRKGVRDATVVAMLTMGLSTFIDRYQVLGTSYEMLDIVLAALYIVASVIMVYYAVSLVFNVSSGSFKGIICLAVLVVLEFGPTIYFTYMGTDFPHLIYDNKDDLVNGTMHLVVLVILTRKEMLLETLSRRLTRNSRYLFNSMSTPKGAYVDIKEKDRIMNGPCEGWIGYENGPVETELPLKVYGAEYGIRLQRWRGDDRIHFVVCIEDASSYSIPLSFPIGSIHLDEREIPVDDDKTIIESRLQFYGNEGMFTEVLLKDPDDEKKGYIDTVKAFIGERKQGSDNQHI